MSLPQEQIVQEALEALDLLRWRCQHFKIYSYAESLLVPENRLARWVREYGLFEKPYAHKYQRKLHLTEADIKLFRSGNRGGKSVGLVNEIAMECEGIHPHQIEGKRPAAPVYWWVICPTLPSDADVPLGEDAPILRKFFEWVPHYDPQEVEDNRFAPLFLADEDGRCVELDKRRIRGIKKFYRKDKLLLFHNGSIVRFKGHDQDLTKVASDDVDGVGHDEESPYRFWHELWARTTDRHGIHVFAMTPTYAAWTWHEFHKSQYENVHIAEIEMDMALNPFIGEPEKRRFFAGLSGQELRMRRYGQYVHAEGLAWQNFKKDKHVILSADYPRINDGDYSIFVIIDWHAAKPIYVTYLAIDAKGDWYVWDESVIHDHDVLSLGTEIESKIGNRRVRKFIIDKNASIQQVQEAGARPKTIVDMLRSVFGIRCIVGNDKNFESGHAFLEEKFKHDEIFFFDRCRTHIEQFATWGVDRRKTGEHRGKFRDRFSDENNDTCINLIYAYNAGCKFTVRRVQDWPLTSYEHAVVG